METLKVIVKYSFLYLSKKEKVSETNKLKTHKI